VKYSSVHIIYNPKSTGDSEQKAKELAEKLREAINKISIVCTATQYAKHAEKIAFEIAKNEKHPLIVSASGDGGYNEVINGVMKAGNNGAICAVLPAGNANDHSRAMHDSSLLEAITQENIIQIDLLKINIRNSKGDGTIRYAHSYAGLGLTPVVAVELNRHTLNALRELVIILRTFLKYRPFKIRLNEGVVRLDSLLFCNINKMAKVLTLAPTNRPDDGKFEIISFPSGHKLQLIYRFTKAMTSRLAHPDRSDHYSFASLKKIPMQIDGEVTYLEANSQVKVEIDQKALKTLV
jgi:diacylglycerol kinase (ATP)